MLRHQFRFSSRPQPATRSLAMDGSEPASGPRLRLERHDPPMAPRDEAIRLVQTGAEIEHALLVQYLFASLSLDTETTQSRSWRRRLLQIAIEEMAHLISVQAILRALGGPLHFEREPRSFNTFYPYPFELQPFGTTSIARYVLAEMPEESVVPDDIKADLPLIRQHAGVASGHVMVNRVGLLFECLKEVADELTDDDFQSQTMALQPTDREWKSTRPERIVQQVTNKAEAIDLINKIAEQGEGSDNPDDLEQSHFFRFYTIWKELHEATGWRPARQVVADPTVVDENAPGYISHPESKAWGALFDIRYRRLLNCLAHSQMLSRVDQTGPGTSPQTQRELLVRWTFDEMYNLTEIGDRLTALPQHDSTDAGSPPTVAGPTFRLPYTLNLPDLPADRWRMHGLVLDESRLHIATLEQHQPSDPLLADLKGADEQAAEKINQLIGEQTMPPEDDDTPDDDNDDQPTPEEQMLALIRKKRDDDNAARRHRFVELPDGRTLEDLFGDENELLQYLLNNNAIQNEVPGHESDPLITPGNPDKSLFFQLIVHDDGIMNGRFEESEVETIRTWIESLT